MTASRPARGAVARLLDADARASDARAWTGNLAIFRIAFVGGIALPAAIGAIGWVEHALPRLPPEAWQPISFFQLLPAAVLTNVTLARGLALANVGLLVLGLIGVRTRWTLGGAAILSTYVLGLPQNQVKVTQNCHIVWFLALLAVGPSASLLSLDAVAAAIRSADRGHADAPRASALALPTLRYVWILFGLIFLMPGLAKLHAALVDHWTDADHVRALFWRTWVLVSSYEPSRPPRAAPIAALPSAVLTAGAWLAIVFEIGFVAAIMVRLLRPFVAAAGVAFHAFTRVTLSIRFASLIPAYVGLIDWVALARSIRGRLGVGRIHLPWGDGRQGRRLTAVARVLDVLDVLAPAERDEASSSSPDPRERGARRWLHVVGVGLVVAQLVVSGARIVSVRAAGTPMTQDTSWWTRWRWPFDAYPDFSTIRTDFDVTEVRLGTRDGGEVAIEPAAYARAYGAASKTWFLFEHALAHEDAQRRQADVAALARAVVARSAAASRGDATEVRVYVVRYAIGGRQPERGDERLTYRFPITADTTDGGPR